MMHNVPVTALALGLTTIALSFLPATTAQADCRWFEPPEPCPAGWRESRREKVGGGFSSMGSVFKPYRYFCCTTPSEPYATGGKEQPVPKQGTPIDKMTGETPDAAEQMGKKEKQFGRQCPSDKVHIEGKGCVAADKQFGRKNTVCAKNDVDIYNSPVEPRNVIGMMNGGTKGAIVERHPDGWSKIQGYGWIANDHFGACP